MEYHAHAAVPAAANRAITATIPTTFFKLAQPFKQYADTSILHGGGGFIEHSSVAENQISYVRPGTLREVLPHEGTPSALLFRTPRRIRFRCVLAWVLLLAALQIFLKDHCRGDGIHGDPGGFAFTDRKS